MTEQFSLLELPLVGGIDQHTDPRKVAPASVLRAENCQILKTGRYDKRYGTTAVTTSMLNGATAMASSYKTLAARDGAVLVTEPDRLLAQSIAKDRFINADRLPGWYATDIPVSQTGGYVNNPDVATMQSGYTCVVYGSEGATIYGASKIIAVIKDAYSGAVVLTTQLSSGTNGYQPRVISRGTIFVCVWTNGTTDIIGRRIDMSASTLAWDTAVNLRTDRTGTGGWDICINNSDSTTWYLAYQTGTGANRVISLYRYGVDASLTSSANSTTGATHDSAYGAVGITHNVLTSRVAVAYVWDNGAGSYLLDCTYQNDTTCANATAAFTVKTEADNGIGGPRNVTLVARTTNGYQCAWTSVVNTAAATVKDAFVETSSLTDAGGRTGTPKVLYTASLVSKLITANSTTYAACCISNNGPYMPTATGEVLDRNIVLVDFTGYDTAASAAVPVPVCTMATRAGTSEIHEGTHSSFLSLDADDGASYITAYGLLSSVIDPVGSNLPPLRVMLSRVTPERGKRQSCELGGLTYFSGGIPTWFDGIRAAEVGFLCQPHVVLASSNGAGAMDTGVDYQYAIVQVQRDNFGNIHRGIPFKRTITMGGSDDTVTAYISYYGCTTRQDSANGVAPVTFEIYRTEGGGTQLRLLDQLLTNLTTSPVLTYTDLAGDVALPYQAFLYDTATPDGVAQLAHVNPPSATLCMTHRDRVWFAGCPNRKEIWVSSKYVQGEAPFFSEAFRIIVDDGGDITAIASMDDKAVIFKEDRIFIVTGDGPDDSGGNSDWSPAIRVNGTVGCMDPRSLVVTPMGIIFRSRVGLAMLTRDLQVDAKFGWPVEDTLNPGGVIRNLVAATLHETKTEVRFLIDSGTEMRWDYGHGAWMLATGLPIQSAKWIGGTLYYLGTSTLVYEDTTLYTDAGSWFTMTLELAPVSVGGRTGYQNVSDIQLLCSHWTAHELLLEVGTDGAGYGDTNQWTAAALTALSASEYVLQYKPKVAGRSRLAKVRISDATPTSGSVGTGRSFSLAACTFRVANKGDKYMLVGSTQKG